MTGVQGSEELTKLMIYSLYHSKVMAGYSWRTAKIKEERETGVWGRGVCGAGGGTGSWGVGRELKIVGEP